MRNFTACREYKDYWKNVSAIGLVWGVYFSNDISCYFQNYLMKSDHPLLPISCLKEGRENKRFSAALAA